MTDITVKRVKEEEKFAASNIFEGMVSIRALISAREAYINDRPIYKVLYDAGKTENKRRELEYLIKMAPRHNFTLCPSDAAEIDAMTVGRTHGGIVAVCGDRSFHPFPSEPKKDGFYIMLEGIEDPYNFGYALRSVYAAGADGAILSPRNWMGAAGVVCRASAGASELMSMYVSGGAEAADAFKKAGYRVICAQKNGAVSAFEAGLRLPLFLVIGGEKRGVSRALSDKADMFIKLDYGRKYAASLSAASAASILAYEVFRQNRADMAERGLS